MAKRKGGGAQGIFSHFAIERIGHKSTIHCISNCSGIWAIDHISYCFTGWFGGGGVLRVSYCSKEPWLAGQLLSSPLPGSAHYWPLQPEAHSSAISLLKGKKQTNKQTTKQK